jgi:SAM-dependent methyltransferase
MDWGSGSYELFAVDLEPAAGVALDALALAPGAELLDVACGNGNLMLAAARRGARVSGADNAPRLVDLARERLDAEGLEAELTVADAEQLPYADDSFDLAASIFGVIFAADRGKACAEMRRVTRPGGAIALTAWLPRGPIGEALKLTRAVAAEHSPPPAPGATRPADAQPLDWSDPGALGELFGARVEISEHTLAFRASSAAAWVEKQREHHPAWLELQEVIPTERFDELSEEVRSLLEAENEDSDALLVHSPYLLALAAGDG